MPRTHVLVEDDCRDLSFIPDSSVQLIVTHPPRLAGRRFGAVAGQLSHSPSYDEYLGQLDIVWEECARVLAPGGIMACVASAIATRETELPVAADIQVRARRFGMEATRSIRWIEPGGLEPHESMFFGDANQPCEEEPGWVQEILIMRGVGRRETVEPAVELASRMPSNFYAACSSPVWRVPRDEDSPHPQSFPLALAERIVRMFSFAGDTVLDPFAGSGTTNEAAILHGRNSIAVEIDSAHFSEMASRLADARWPEGEIRITGKQGIAAG